MGIWSGNPQSAQTEEAYRASIARAIETVLSEEAKLAPVEEKDTVAASSSHSLHEVPITAAGNADMANLSLRPCEEEEETCSVVPQDDDAVSIKVGPEAEPQETPPRLKVRARPKSAAMLRRLGMFEQRESGEDDASGSEAAESEAPAAPPPPPASSVVVGGGDLVGHEEEMDIADDGEVTDAVPAKQVGPREWHVSGVYEHKALKAGLQRLDLLWPAEGLVAMPRAKDGRSSVLLRERLLVGLIQGAAQIATTPAVDISAAHCDLRLLSLRQLLRLSVLHGENTGTSGSAGSDSTTATTDCHEAFLRKMDQLVFDRLGRAATAGAMEGEGGSAQLGSQEAQALGRQAVLLVAASASLPGQPWWCWKWSASKFAGRRVYFHAMRFESCAGFPSEEILDGAGGVLAVVNDLSHRDKHELRRLDWRVALASCKADLHSTLSLTAPPTPVQVTPRHMPRPPGPPPPSTRTLPSQWSSQQAIERQGAAQGSSEACCAVDVPPPAIPRSEQRATTTPAAAEPVGPGHLQVSPQLLLETLTRLKKTPQVKAKPKPRSLRSQLKQALPKEFPLGVSGANLVAKPNLPSSALEGEGSLQDSSRLTPLPLLPAAPTLTPDLIGIGQPPSSASSEAATEFCPAPGGAGTTWLD